MVISITNSGYIKSLPLSTYRQQRRGGIGVTGMDMKDDDYIEHLFVASTHDYLLFFTNRGKIYRLKVYELPEASRTAKGRALVNSITAEDDRMEAILPLVKRYDAAIIALPNDAEEIPMEAGRRLELVAHIVEVATKEYGIAIEDIVIDPLAMPIGSDTSVVNTALDTMRQIRDEFGLNMTCGASNVSFGMPDRHTLGAAFLPMAMTAGLTSAIMDTRTPQIVASVKAADLLLGHDEWGGSWIAAHRKKLAAT